MIAALVERVRGCPAVPQTNAQRLAGWYARAANAGVPMLTGPLWQRFGREYERQAMNDAEPVDPNYEH